jgi:hypothetical protein
VRDLKEVGPLNRFGDFDGSLERFSSPQEFRVPIYLIPSLTSITKPICQEADTYMVKFDDSGLKRIQRNLENLHGKHNLTEKDLLPDDFIQENTNFQTRDAFLEASGIKSQEDMHTDAFDSFVAANTRFANWQEMFKAAGAEWGNRQLLAGLE